MLSIMAARSPYDGSMLHLTNAMNLGVTCTQQYLKPYKPKVCHPLPAKSKNSAPAQGIPKHDTKSPDKLDFKSADDMKNIHQTSNGL